MLRGRGLGGCGGGAVTSIVRDARQGEGQAASGGREGGRVDGVQHRGRRSQEAAVGAAHHVARPRRAGVRNRRPPEGHGLRASEGRPGGGQRRCAVRRQGEACGDAAAAPSRASRAGEKGGRRAVLERAAARTTCSTEGDERRRPAAAPRSTWPERGVCGCDGGAVASDARQGEGRAPSGGWGRRCGWRVAKGATNTEGRRPRRAASGEGKACGGGAPPPSRAPRPARAGGTAGGERRCSDGVISDLRYPPPTPHQPRPIVLGVGGDDVSTWRDGKQLCAVDSPMSGQRLDAD